MIVLIFDNSDAQNYKIQVSSGEFNRSETVVSFSFPGIVDPGIYLMRTESGNTVYLQVGENSRGHFILDQLEANSTKAYFFDSQSKHNGETGKQVRKKIDRNTITFSSDKSEILSYYHGVNDPPDELDARYKRGGYIHPVYSPSGTLLTNHLNVDAHPHHSGIWSAWTVTEFQGRNPDFWNIHNNTGRVDQADSLEAAWEGPVHAGFRAYHYFTDLSAQAPVTALNEQWVVHVYPAASSGRYHMFDLEVTQTANTAQPLVLPEFRYGGIGFRGHIDWDDPDNMTFLTSDGLGRDGHATRARWCHIGGYSDGKLAGIAVLGHPENFRHPQPMRIHPREPFFNFAPQQLGDMVIEPGSPYVVRYRYITYDGEPDPDELNRMWNDYAYPPGVTVTAN
ncbi:MAG: PmoA family protein [Balneolaceae bacterium]